MYEEKHLWNADVIFKWSNNAQRFGIKHYHPNRTARTQDQFVFQDHVERRFNRFSWRLGPSLSGCCAAGRNQEWRRRRRALLARRPLPSRSAWRWCWRAARTGNHRLERKNKVSKVHSKDQRPVDAEQLQPHISYLFHITVFTGPQVTLVIVWPHKYIKIC